MHLEVGLPAEGLRNVEVVDFPGSSNPLLPMDLSTILRQRPDAAIWATVATQAWRETERTAWMSLPAKVRKYGVLAVTHRDLIASEGDFKKLSARLNPVASSYFSCISFLSKQRNNEATPVSAGEDHREPELLQQLHHLKDAFEMQKIEQALAATHRIAHRVLMRLGSAEAE